jgi:hypothetical protein
VVQYTWQKEEERDELMDGDSHSLRKKKHETKKEYAEKYDQNYLREGLVVEGTQPARYLRHSNIR